MNILIVDDEAVQLISLRRALAVKGHSVVEAENAEHALDILKSRPGVIHMVITDYLMPRMNGVELLKAVRKNHGALPVLMLSAYANQEVLVEAMRNGCNGFIAKPFSPNELHQEIQRIQSA